MIAGSMTRRAGIPPVRRPEGSAAYTCVVVAAGLSLLVLAGFLGFSSSPLLTALDAPTVAVAVTLLSLPILRRGQLRGESRDWKGTLFRLLAFALALKLAGALVRHYVISDVYEGSADATGYVGAGAGLAAQFRSGVVPDLGPLTGTNFMKVLTGGVFAVIGPSVIGGFFFFSWLAFLGMALFWRAVTLAMPETDGSRYARLLFFLPSMLFWPSSVGKDAWMVFTLGLAAFGAAHLLSGRSLPGLVTTCAGLWLGGIVRPHVAAMGAIAVASAALLRPAPRRLRELAPLVKMVSTGVVVVAAAVFVAKGSEFLSIDLGAPSAGIAGAVEASRLRTSQGGSEFSPTGISPMAPVTVLYRPFLFEAHNMQQLIAALEGTVLLVLTVARRRVLWRTIRSAARQPFVAFALVFSVVSILGFSTMGNFGIIARQRVQVLPFFLVLIAARRPDARTRGGEVSQPAAAAR